MAQHPTLEEDVDAADETGLRISDAATRAGVSARTLRYYEELGLLTPSGRTAGGERRYRPYDLSQLDRIIELKEVIGMNLEEIKGFMETQGRLDELRTAYRARRDEPTARARKLQREILQESLSLNESLAQQLHAKLERMNEFRSQLLDNAARCRDLLKGFGDDGSS